MPYVIHKMNEQGVREQIGDGLDSVYAAAMKWRGLYPTTVAPWYIGDVVRDGNWTMVCIAEQTSDRPAPIATTDPVQSPPMDSMAWTENFVLQQCNSGNEWTLGPSGGWVTEVTANVNVNNVGLVHTVVIYINGSIEGEFTFTPTAAGVVAVSVGVHVVGPGSVIHAYLRVDNLLGNERCYFDEVVNYWPAGNPPWAASVKGILNSVINNNAYGVGIVFTEGAVSPDWQVVALSGGTGGGAVGGDFLPLAGGTMTGNIVMSGATTVDGRDVSADGALLDIVKTRYIGQNLQTGTSYTLALTDAGKMIEMNNAAANTLTIPANTLVAFPVDTRIDVCQFGAGQTTVGITTDTLRGDPKSPGQYKLMSLWKRSATQWVISGGIT
jgi:hypothetical protein